MSQGLQGLEASSGPGRNEPGENANDESAATNENNVSWNDNGGKIGEVINPGRKQFEARETVHGVKELVAIGQGEHAKSKPGENTGNSNSQTLAEEKPEDLALCSAKGFEHADFAGLLHHKCDQRIHDAEG